MGKILIKNDLYNISARLKQIDKNYLLTYNTNSKRFEVYYQKGLNLSLELVLPFSSLDARTIDYVLKTRVENKQKLFLEMEQNNERLEKSQTKNMLDEASYKATEMMKYAQSNPSEFNINFFDTYKEKWI